jgi:hypothetical protein
LAHFFLRFLQNSNVYSAKFFSREESLPTDAVLRFEVFRGIAGTATLLEGFRNGGNPLTARYRAL